MAKVIESVILGTKCCLKNNFDFFQSGTNCIECPYRNNDHCINELGHDIIVFLEGYLEDIYE